MQISPTHRLLELLPVRKLPFICSGLFISFTSTFSVTATHAGQDESAHPNEIVKCVSRDKDWECATYSTQTGQQVSSDSTNKGSIAYDWVHKSLLSEIQRSQLVPGCEGMYVDPTLAISQSLESTANPDQLPLIIEADSSIVSQNERAEISGNVKVSQGSRLLSAERMSYDLLNDVAQLQESVTIRNPGVLIRGEKAEVIATRHEAAFEEAMFVLHEPGLRGGADAIKQTSAASLELIGGRFTSCEPNDNSWVLEGERIAINTETNQGMAKNVKLKVGKVPVLYLPYMSFPVGDDRQSGFLFPSLNIVESSGVDFALPYYWNIAPNYDMTITPRYITKRGAMLETEARHMNSKFSTVGRFTYLPNDNGGGNPNAEKYTENGTITEEQAAPYKGQRRWLVHFDQAGGGTTFPWYTSIEYTKVSDVGYFDDLGTTSFSVQSNTHLNQSIRALYQFEHWNISTLLQDYQVLLIDVDDPYKRAPQINFDGSYSLGDLGLRMDHEYTHFDHGNSIWRSGDSIIKGSRFTTDYRAQWNKRAPWGFFVPETGFQTLSYQFDKDSISQDTDDAPTLGTAQGSLDMGLIFEHAGGSILQTIEPRLFYLYRDYEDHSQLFNVTDDGQYVNFDTSNRTFSYSQLFRDSRFSGGDRLDDANRLTIGLTTRWFSNDSGRELLTASAGQIFYYEDRRVGLETDVETEESSEIAADARLALGPFTTLFASAIYDEEQSEFIRSSGGVNYASTDYRQIANLSYSYVKDRGQQESSQRGDIDQFDLSFLAPMTRQWFVMGRTKYDQTHEQELETFLGLEYNNCCYRIRALARRWLDSNIATLVDEDTAIYDSGVFFEIQLKGLGSSGAKVDDILNDSIMGYEEREKLLNH